MGRARSFNDAHNSSRQQGDWAYRAIDEREGGGCFYSRAEKAFPGTNGKVGEGGPLTTPNSSSCCQEGLELCFHPLSPLSVLGSWSCSLGRLRCSQFYYLWAWLIVRQFLKIFIPFQFLGNKIKLSWFGVVIRRSELLISSAAPRQKVWRAPAWRGRAGRLMALRFCELGIAWSPELCPQRLKKKMV